MKDPRFTDEEWETVKSVPFQAFGMVAGADGVVDEKEVGELLRRMTSGAIGYKDPIMRALASEIAGTDWSPLIKRAMDPAQSHPETIRTMLRDKLTTSEYQSFLGSIFIDCLAVARASGGGGFKDKGPVSDEEASALQAIVVFYGIDLPGLKERFG